MRTSDSAGDVAINTTEALDHQTASMDQASLPARHAVIHDVIDKAHSAIEFLPAQWHIA